MPRPNLNNEKRVDPAAGDGHYSTVINFLAAYKTLDQPGQIFDVIPISLKEAAPAAQKAFKMLGQRERERLVKETGLFLSNIQAILTSTNHRWR